MSFGRVRTGFLFGLEVSPLFVETDVSNGIPLFQMVGYLSSEVKEATARVRSGIRNAGVSLQPKRITVNLAPATLRKRGTSYDLPIAISVLIAYGWLPQSSVEDSWLIGELGLDGSVRKTNGILPILLCAKERGMKRCILPLENVEEANLVSNIEVIGVASLGECIEFLQTGRIRERKGGKEWNDRQEEEKERKDFSQVVGQKMAKRAIEISVSGGHNLLMIGSPGSGKTMLAERIPSILPSLEEEEKLEIAKIHSISGAIKEERISQIQRPFRSVHHTVTRVGLVGGGRIPHPGEISLSHKGVLFLDEMPEFQKSVLEGLRQPLEKGWIEIQREMGSFRFPADFMLVGAANQCPCGNFPDLNRCRCTEKEIQSYLGKISQPLLDRMDLCVETSKVSYQDLQEGEAEESSARICERVKKVREIQKQRYQKFGYTINARLDVKDLKEVCVLGKKEESILEKAFERLGLTARTYHKVLKVARTIADMEESDFIQENHIREELGYRMIQKI